MIIKNTAMRILSTIVVPMVLILVAPATMAQNYDPIPHSTVAVAQGAGINKATLSCATSRYTHAVLGDGIEAGCLAVETEDGVFLVHKLPENHVFEDLVPHIADFDGNGTNDVAVVRSDDAYGAALVLYTTEKTADNAEGVELVELGSTPPIGRAFRWLAPIGGADFNDDGQLDIAYVQTPHIGGILKVWTMQDGQLVQLAQLRGFSNHGIGSTRVSTAKIVDHNDDGVMDIALPDQRRQKIVWVTLSPELNVLGEQAYDEAYFD